MQKRGKKKHWWKMYNDKRSRIITAMIAKKKDLRALRSKNRYFDELGLLFSTHMQPLSLVWGTNRHGIFTIIPL
jgi:hypothetical protein